jgi:hypothetical protein
MQAGKAGYRHCDKSSFSFTRRQDVSLQRVRLERTCRRPSTLSVANEDQGSNLIRTQTIHDYPMPVAVLHLAPAAAPRGGGLPRMLLSTGGRTPLPPRRPPAAALHLAPAAHPAKPPSTVLNLHTPQGDKNAEYVWRFSLF